MLGAVSSAIRAIDAGLRPQRRKPLPIAETQESREADIDRFAIFVDAGYFFAEGSRSLIGRRERRHALQLDQAKAIETIKQVAGGRLPKQELLRIYWYDGMLGHNMSDDQAAMAALDDVKLRLGAINEEGTQKGVDALIVTDLIELARLNAICDAVLLSGDEDVRIGVQIAQNYGVRVHLLGIATEVQSLSEKLLQEADTVPPPLTQEQIQEFLRHTPGDNEKIIADAVRDFVNELTPEDREESLDRWKAREYDIPQLLDRRLLPHCRERLGRFLEPDETRHMRDCFWRSLVVPEPD